VFVCQIIRITLAQIIRITLAQIIRITLAQICSSKHCRPTSSNMRQGLKLPGAETLSEPMFGSVVTGSTGKKKSIQCKLCCGNDYEMRNKSQMSHFHPC